MEIQHYQNTFGFYSFEILLFIISLHLANHSNCFEMLDYSREGG